MMRYTGLHVALYGSAIVHNHPVSFACVSVSSFINMGCWFFYSAPSSRSEPSPKTSRQSLSIKQAFLGSKADGRLHSPHSPKAGEERRALKGKDVRLF